MEGSPHIRSYNFYHKRLDLFEKKAMREIIQINVQNYANKSEMERKYTDLLKVGEGERKIYTVNCNNYIRRVILSWGGGLSNELHHTIRNLEVSGILALYVNGQKSHF